MDHNRSNKYWIAIMKVGSEDITELTDGRLDESSSFSPNGQIIIFVSELNRRGSIFTVTKDGDVYRVRNQLFDACEPAWEPKNSGYVKIVPYKTNN